MYQESLRNKQMFVRRDVKGGENMQGQRRKGGPRKQQQRLGAPMGTRLLCYKPRAVLIHGFAQQESIDVLYSYDIQIGLDVPRTINRYGVFKTQYRMGQVAWFVIVSLTPSRLGQAARERIRRLLPSLAS